MGLDYALVHLKYTIPPALALSYCYYPLCTGLGVYKVLFLITIAVVSATPWDSFLVRHRIWTYPPNAVLGPTLFSIPMEEVFFFVIQTYATSILYLIISKPTFHPAYLRGAKLLRSSKGMTFWRWFGNVVILTSLVAGTYMTVNGGKGLYMGMIIIWAAPFILLLWNLAFQLILGLPMSNTVVPIAAPTLYLWIVDTFALKRGTWVIELGTKLNFHMWSGLDVEEAVFFFATNTLIVFGLIAFDNAVAVIDAFPAIFPRAPAWPSPLLLIQALLISIDKYDDFRIAGLQEALGRLRAKSRSFYLASGTFEGRLRIDLILLYSFCRLADDLVDNAKTAEEALHWIGNFRGYLDKAYSRRATRRSTTVDEYVNSNFPSAARSGLLLLPTSYLSSDPLYDLLKGFEMDVQFSGPDKRFPIIDLETLHVYGSRVAGTVADLILELVYHHTTSVVTESPQREKTMQAGLAMGIALQTVNIARDITVDAANGRVYIPKSWLAESDLRTEDVIKAPDSSKIESLRHRLLDDATQMYKEARPYLKTLPPEARGPMRVAVESYLEIGRVLRQPGYKVKAGRATVPKLRRVRVAWGALLED